tara:strand:- start:39 stop:1022 length:984 start_codon:yes stop_codon:yes gene_type:complete
MKKILLTGGLGYIGSRFYEKYQNKYNISILDTGFFTDRNKILNKNVQLIDIREIKKEYFEDIDFVVHMGELSNDPLGDLDPSLTKEINHLATKNLLEIANSSKIKKFIYMSSASIYGFSEEISNEKSELNPLTEYSKAKYKNEKFIIENNFNFETIMLRNSTAFGYSSNLRLDLVVNDLTYGGLVNNEISLLSDGSPKRPLVHVDDICNFINIVLDDDRNLDKEIFNVGHEELNYSIKEIAESIAKILNIENLKFGDFDSDQRSYYLSFDKVKQYFPEYTIEYNLLNGVSHLVENLNKYKLTGNEKRLKKIDKLLNTKKLDEKLYWV